MTEGFQRYLINNGFKRETYELYGKKCIWFEENDSMSVSSYGPTVFRFTKGDFYFYWGLGVYGHHPYYYYPTMENWKMILSGNHYLDLSKILDKKIETIFIS